MMDKKIYENMRKHNKYLSDYACTDDKVIRFEKESEDFRPGFFRDIDRIIYSLSYVRYMDKTQVFTETKNDHIQKRMIHVQYVSKIARTIGRALNLNEDLIEAAKIDGANKWNTLIHVTIPNIMPSITICLFLTLTNGFKLFDQNLALTAGEPSHGTEMVALNIYNTFYGSTSVFRGVGQAKAVIFALILALIGVLQMRLTSGKGDK